MHEITMILANRFFGSLLEDCSITDIFFNGTTIYYLSSQKGRVKYLDFDKIEALNLMRQIANLTNQLFTFQNPILDVVFDHYRLSAVHPLIGRNGEDNAVIFAIRIANTNKHLLIETGMINQKIKETLLAVISRHKSIAIIGLTGVGKTELQKYLIGLLSDFSRVIIIDQGVELAITQKLYPHLDITMWRYDNKLFESSLPNLIKTSLRFNPDFLVIAEARGHEILDIYNASLSGHPSFFTIHSDDVNTTYRRMLSMANYQEGLNEVDFALAFPFVIEVKKIVKEGKIIRKITNIVSFEQGIENPQYLYSDETEN